MAKYIRKSIDTSYTEDKVESSKDEIVLDENKTLEEMTCTTITRDLMSFKVTFHVLHFQTKSYAKHKALEKFYSEITDLADDIIECLLGRERERLDNELTIVSNPFLSPEVENSINDHMSIVSDFANRLFKWSENLNYSDINNLAAELTQLVNKTLYRLSLS